MKQKKKKGKRPSLEVAEVDTSTIDGEHSAIIEEEAEKTGKWTRAQLLAHMNRRLLSLDLDGLELRLEWHIAFDWTGEAESRLSAGAFVPASCEFSPLFLPSLSRMSE